MLALPRQLSDLSPEPGLIKADYEDFVVEELPLYPADGVGTHTYFLVEKTGLGTMQAASDIARALNVRRHEIGFAGLKDARAVARQWMSVEHVDPALVMGLRLPRLRVLSVTRHRNKLRLGHLRGNRFIVRVRQADPRRLAELQDGLAELQRRGVPNYFGVQRFGYRGDNWAVGRALVRGEVDEAVDRILGRPMNIDRGQVRRARELYEDGRYAEAARAWPRMFRLERRALLALVKSAGKRRQALAAVDRAARDFYISAYQSYLFNQVVATRLKTGLGRLWPGDLAWLHASGAVFRVEDVEAEQPRADCFDISPTGPLFGHRMSQPRGAAGELERRLFLAESLPDPAELANHGLRVQGGRRPLRYRPHDASLELGADARGPYLELRFVLPRGCYATALLAELFDLSQAGAAADEPQETENPALG